MDCDRFSITPDSVLWQENAWHVGASDMWRWQIALISPDVNYPRLSQRSTGDWENLSNVFHNLTVGSIGDPIWGLHTCLSTQTADLQLLQINFSQIRCRFWCTLRCRSDQLLISKVTDCRDWLFPCTSKFRSNYFRSITSHQSLNIFPPIFKIEFDFVSKLCNWKRFPCWIFLLDLISCGSMCIYWSFRLGRSETSLWSNVLKVTSL